MQRTTLLSYLWILWVRRTKYTATNRWCREPRGSNVSCKHGDANNNKHAYSWEKFYVAIDYSDWCFCAWSRGLNWENLHYFWFWEPENLHQRATKEIIKLASCGKASFTYQDFWRRDSEHERVWNCADFGKVFGWNGDICRCLCCS